jgi:hypothetical protein
LSEENPEHLAKAGSWRSSAERRFAASDFSDNIHQDGRVLFFKRKSSQGAITPSMHQSNPSNPTSHRPILKLKISARKSPREVKTQPPRPNSKLKPGARWSE